jgi:hypothetical protein
VSLNVGDRYQLREIWGVVDQAQLAAQSAVRGYRNVLSVAVFVLLVCSVAFPLAARGFSSDVLTVRAATTSPVATSAPPAPSSTSAPASTATSAASAVPGASASATIAPSSAAAVTPAPSAASRVLASDANASPGPTFGDLATIEGWGVLGGLIGAVASLRRLRTSRDPAGLHLAQLALKLPAGALTALFGVVLMQSEIVPPLRPATGGQIAAYAVLFGFAQEAITRFVDQQSGRILDGAQPLSAKTASVR